MLNISHLNKDKDPEFDLFFKEKFHEHIVTHFRLSADEMKAGLVVISSGGEKMLTLHYHYHKQHHHLHSHGTNIYESGTKLITELEKTIRRKKKERLDKRKKGTIKNLLEERGDNSNRKAVEVNAL